MAAEAAKIRLDGYRVVIANGLIKDGFQDSCDKVFMETEFDYISQWCRRNFIDYEVLEKEEKPAPKKTAAKPAAKAASKTEEVEDEK